jgi:hypothetical protein
VQRRVGAIDIGTDQTVGKAKRTMAFSKDGDRVSVEQRNVIIIIIFQRPQRRGRGILLTYD